MIYEVYVDKFAGDFAGMIGKLDYLKRLGVDCVWILPHYPSPMMDDGYDISDYYGIRSDLGTLADFKRFLREAHGQGIKVVIDLVLNHTSDQHPWFIEARTSKSNDKRDYYIWSRDGHEFDKAENPFSFVKERNWITNSQTGDFYYATFYPQQPDLNWDNPVVVAEMMKVIDGWLKMGVDGLRLDAITRLVKREGTDCKSLPETHQIIKNIRQHIDENYENVLLIAETTDLPDKARKYFGNGDECQMVFHFYLSVKMWEAFMDGEEERLGEIVNETFNLPSGCSWGTFLTNHDSLALHRLGEAERLKLGKWMDPEERFSAKPASKVSMRTGEIFKGDKRKIINAFRTWLELPGTPVIYYGEEIGMCNLMLTQKPSDTRRFVRGDFDWKEAKRQMDDRNSVWSQVGDLIKNRREKDLW